MLLRLGTIDIGEDASVAWVGGGKGWDCPVYSGVRSIPPASTPHMSATPLPLL